MIHPIQHHDPSREERMTNEERRELEKLAAKWEHASEALVDGEVCCHKLCADHLRATLDRLTDEQSGEESAGYPDRPDLLLACDNCGETQWMIADDGLYEPTTEPKERRERLVELHGITLPFRRESLDTGSLTAPEVWTCTRCGWSANTEFTPAEVFIFHADHCHRSPEPPDSTEPEDDVVERVARWLMDHHDPDGLTTYDLASIEPTEEWRNRASNLIEWLHDTGILTKESETP